MDILTLEGKYILKIKNIKALLFNVNKQVTRHLSVFIFFTILIPFPLTGLEKTYLKIGTYENAPKIYTDKQGNISGFWAEIIKCIAENENWELEWIHGDWSKCMERLENNEIDIMMDVGLTPARQEKFLFSNETVLLSWSRLYTKKGINLDSIMDLEGKKIAGLKGSFNIEGPEGLKDIIVKFGLNSEIVEMKDYLTVFNAIESGEVFAGITNKDFGSKYELDFDVQRTSIIFQPSQMQFAFPGDSENAQNLIKVIDKNLKMLKSNNRSIYFTAMETHLGGIEVINNSQTWMVIVLASSLVTMVICSIFKRLLKYKIHQKTLLFQKDIIHQKKIKENLEYSRSVLQTQLESSADGILAVGLDGIWIGYNQNYIDIWDIPDSIFKTKNDSIALEYVTKKIKFPDKFMAKTNDIYNNPKLESFDVIELKNGQIIERFSKPQMLKENIIGRVWSYRNITSRRQAEKEIQQKLQEKETILKEVHHRVKNNFASITSLLSLQTESLSNQEAKSALNEAIGRINSMQILYDKMLLNDDYGITSIKQYLENLIDDIIILFSKNTKIQIKTQIEDFKLDSKYLFPIGIIVNELLTNIIKYAFTGRELGFIEIIVHKKHELITLSIKDDGIGLADDFDMHKSHSMGLMLINILSSQLEGNFSILNDNGTKSTLEFSIKTNSNESKVSDTESILLK